MTRALYPSSQGAALSAEPYRIDILSRVAAVVERTTGIFIADRSYGKLGAALSKIVTGSPQQWVLEYEQQTERHPAHASLIEQLTVHETYFYRDERQLEFFRTKLLPDLLRKKLTEGASTFRLWSAACSTGEEAYTLAIIASEALTQLSREPAFIMSAARLKIEVLATDLSRAVLAKAQEGVYRSEGMGSFRGVPKFLLDYFSITARSQNGRSFEELTPLAAIKRMVSFRQFNLTSPMPPQRGFDVVFCRNVLIYMQDDVRLRVFQMLERALDADGYLLFGPTDSLKGAELFHLHQNDGQSYYTRKA